MLQLKKVQILGFKSFCDRTEVQLAGTGIAAVVGPNGCGKSNISDAITWVLGEQSAKSLRGIKMEDVIFAGTRDRRPTGMAEVTLTLIDPEVYDTNADKAEQQHNRDLELAGDWDESAIRTQAAQATEDATAEAQPGPLTEGEDTEADPETVAQDAEQAEGEAQTGAQPGAPVVLRVRRRKFNRTPARAGEISVTRRLFRSGESEYLLNGKLCRLRDIQDIFFGTGLGGESYAIIGQERIGQLLSSKPLDRRAIIEEAAGITRFKTKKRLAELRLESARQNLARVNDIFEEVTRQLAVLKRQAAKAERYGELRTELQSKLRVVLASRLAQMDADTAATAAELERLGKLIDEGAATVETADAEHTAGVSRGYELDAALREANSRVNATAVELERTRARIDSNRDRIADLAQRATAAEADLASVREQAQTLAGERESQRSFLATATEEANVHRSEAQARTAEAHASTREVLAAEASAENTRRSVNQAMQRGHSAANEIAQAEAALAGFDRENERLQNESETARRELESMGQQRGQAKLNFESITDRLKSLERELVELRQRLEQRRMDETQGRRKNDALRSERAQLNGRRNSLDQLIREHSYSTDTVRNLFRADAKKTASQPNTGMQPLGTLADFLEVEGRFENVVDEFLRDELNFIVVRDWNSAEAGIKLLQGEVNGRATFLVADALTANAETPEEIAVPEGVTALRNCVQGGSSKGLDLGSQLTSLLPRLSLGFVCPNDSVARDLSVQHPTAFFLAPTGEVFHRATVTGGKPRTQGPLALKRELGELQMKIGSVEGQMAENEQLIAATSREIAELNASVDSRNHERRDAERESANLGAAMRGLESEAQRLERRLGEWQLSLSRNADQRRSREETIARKREEAEQFAQERARLEQQVSELTSTIARLRERRESLQAAASEANAALAGLEERRRNAVANFERTDRLFAGLQQRAEQLTSQIAGFAAERIRREEESTQLEAQREQLATDRATATEEAKQLSEEATHLRETVAALDAQLRTLRAALDAQREQRSNQQARAARLAADLEHLQGQCINDLSLEPQQLREDSTIQHISADALLSEEETVRSLRKRMEAMGPVNMMALEEYTETAERHTFLEGQRKDLLEAIENTTASIKEIDEVSQQKFDEAFGIINQNFSDTFTKLFGGGQAFMRLTDPEQNSKGKDSDLNGIDIIASPPGKKLQNVLLLSGGEKALTALSLLVGIFQFQPAPFCVLDEVDAPLDETNVGRFARLIADMAETTQFIVITHSKRTMEQADVMYGVTMQEPGVSKIVSVSLGGRSRGKEARTAA